MLQQQYDKNLPNVQVTDTCVKRLTSPEPPTITRHNTTYITHPFATYILIVMEIKRTLFKEYIHAHSVSDDTTVTSFEQLSF